MLFTYDRNKSLRNLEKHGIDFKEAQALWSDDNRLEFKLMHTGEQRYGVLARYGGSTWFGVFIRRGLFVRIISVRRATKQERSLYDRKNA